MDEPLIYTTLGNVPVSSLSYHTEWTDAPDYVKFREWYIADGVVVKESAHVLSKHGVAGDGAAGKF